MATAHVARVCAQAHSACAWLKFGVADGMVPAARFTPRASLVHEVFARHGHMDRRVVR
jgi:hypothetical protein